MFTNVVSLRVRLCISKRTGICYKLAKPINKPSNSSGIVFAYFMLAMVRVQVNERE